jgi:hypothetical protein
MKATLRGHVLSSQKIYINKKKKNPKQTNKQIKKREKMLVRMWEERHLIHYE